MPPAPACAPCSAQKGAWNEQERLFPISFDVVAGDQVPKDLNLAPNIMTRIQKQERFSYATQNKVYFRSRVGCDCVRHPVFTPCPEWLPPPGAPFGRWFGYVPGVGFVREGQIRVLESPVSVTREGVTVTVEQVVLDPERTALVYSVEGIPATAVVSSPMDQHCPYEVSLRLPDGTPDAPGEPGWDPILGIWLPAPLRLPARASGVNDASW